MDVFLLDISYKRVHSVCGFCVWLISPRKVFLRFIHLVADISIVSLFWLSTIPPYDQVEFCLSIHQVMDSGLPSCGDENKYLDIYVQVFESSFSVFLGMELGVHLLGHVVILRVTY